MTPEEQAPTVGKDDNGDGDEVAAAGEAGDAPEAPAAPMNRAQRRAMARGKGSGASESHSFLPNANNPRGSGQHGAGNTGKTRLPRTGHK